MRTLKSIELWSTCCGATVYDPGWTGEWICTDCKEHCWIAYSREISVMVMDFANGRVHHHVLTNDEYIDEDDEEGSRVENWVHNTYWNDCEFMYSADKYLEFLDHSNLSPWNSLTKTE
jgi:RecJ-like exonuclease